MTLATLLSHCSTCLWTSEISSKDRKGQKFRRIYWMDLSTFPFHRAPVDCRPWGQSNELLEQKQVFIQEQQAHIEELTRKLQSTQQQLKALQHQVEQLLKRIYGRSSEKFDPNQLRMFEDKELIEAIEGEQGGSAVELPEAVTVAEKRKPLKAKRKHPGRIPIPEHLERVEIILDLPEEKKVCPETGKPLKQIGWEISEKLEYRPGRLFVNVYKRPKYVSPDPVVSESLGVITASMARSSHRDLPAAGRGARLMWGY